MIRYLSRGNVEQLGISGSSIADAIAKSLQAAASGDAENVPKSGIQLSDGRLFQSITAVGTAAPAPPYAATKIVGLSPDNHHKGLPHIGSVIVLLDSVTGLPCCIMDGSWITEYRTAALSLLVARRYALSGANCMGLVACGAQARAHLNVFKEEFELKQITAYSRRVETAQAFAEWATQTGIDCVVANEPRQSVENQDIVISSVPDHSQPLGYLRAQWLKPGAFAGLVDLGRSWNEKGFESVEHCIVDNRAQAEKSMATRRFTPSGPFTQDLQEMIANPAAQRRSNNERAVFVFQGLALADLAAAALVFDQASAEGTGTLLPE